MKKFRSPPIHRTPLYRAKRAYKDMLVRCGNPKGINPTYTNVKIKMTMEEWLTWAIPKYQRFIAKHPNESPSVSRFGDKGDYELSNLEIITLLQNRAQQAAPNLLKTNGTKRCSQCRAIKTAKDFNKNKSRRDGLSHWCRVCANATYHGSVTRAAKGTVS